MSDEMTQAELDEVRRDRRIWTTLIVLGIVVTAGVMALGWGLIEGRLAAAKQLDEAIALLKDTDSTLAAVDEIVHSPVGAEAAGRAVAVVPRIDSAQEKLTRVIELANSGTEKLTDDEQEQAVLVGAAAKARIDTLESSRDILAAAKGAAAAHALATQGWTKTLAADQLAKQAVADYNKLTKASVSSALETNKTAAAGFAEARDLFSEAATAFPDADLAVFVDYADSRIALVSLSSSANKAWLAGNPARANDLIARYNTLDAKAVAAAKELPPSPSNAVENAYRALATATTSAYFKAREKADEADEALRTM